MGRLVLEVFLLAAQMDGLVVSYSFQLLESHLVQNL